jgi:hypothetical protein
MLQTGLPHYLARSLLRAAAQGPIPQAFCFANKLACPAALTSLLARNAATK